jgi:hypothetical protein
MEDNLNYFLPHGEYIRTQLIKPEISDADLKSILKKRGQFLPRYTKQDTIPILMRALLGPEVYQDMIDQKKQREENIKYRNEQLPWLGSNDLLKHLPVSINLEDIIRNKFKYNPGFSLLNCTNFTQEDGRIDKASMSFSIEETSDIASIDERSKVFEGKVTLEIKDDGKIYLSTIKNFTSKNTQVLVDGITQVLEKDFKAQGVVNPEETYEKILFSHFTNTNRFLFFIKFIDTIGLMNNKKVTDVSLSPDPDKSVPADAKKFLTDIDRLNFKGKQLIRNPFLAEISYRDSIILSSISVLYEFDHSEGKGVCELEYTFPDYSPEDTDKVEFQFLVSRVTLNHNYRAYADKKKITKAIYNAVQEHTMHNYNSLKIQ